MAKPGFQTVRVEAYRHVMCAEDGVCFEAEIGDTLAGWALLTTADNPDVTFVF